MSVTGTCVLHFTVFTKESHDLPNGSYFERFLAPSSSSDFERRLQLNSRTAFISIDTNFTQMWDLYQKYSASDDGRQPGVVQFPLTFEFVRFKGGTVDPHELDRPISGWKGFTSGDRFEVHTTSQIPACLFCQLL